MTVKALHVEETNEFKFKTCNTLLASYILFRTRCKYRLIRGKEGEPVYIALAISPEKGEELESDFATSETQMVDAVKSALTKRIRNE